MQTISFFYDDYKKVQNVLAELQKFGVPASATKLVACDADERYRTMPIVNDVASAPQIGAAFGGVAGIIAGAMIATGGLEVPGFGAWAAMSVLMLCAIIGTGGALIGWLSGSLTQLIYAKNAGPGSGTMITVHTSSERAGFVEAILRSGLAINPSKRMTDYQDKQWTIDASAASTVIPLETRFQRSNFQS